MYNRIFHRILQTGESKHASVNPYFLHSINTTLQTKQAKMNLVPFVTIERTTKGYDYWNLIQDMGATLRHIHDKPTRLHCFGHDHNVLHKDTMITRVWMGEVYNTIHLLMLIEKIQNPSTNANVFKYVTQINDFYYIPNKQHWLQMDEVQKVQQVIDKHSLRFTFLR
jgi:hypothetical protein